MNISRVFILRPVATALLTLGLALAGILAFVLLPIAPLPQVDYPTISVSASLPGASAETMASTVASPLERALGSIAGVTEITSSSSLGNSRITLQFELDRDVNAAARNVQAAINASRALLPSGMPGNPTYRLVNPSDTPIMILALQSDTLGSGAVFDAASTILAQRLSQVDGIGDVAVGGGALPAVRVRVDPNRLAAHGLSLEQVRTALSATNVSRPKGAVEQGERQWQIGANDQARVAAEYAPLILSYRNGAAIRLQDVAQVKDSVQDERAHGLVDGHPAVLLFLYKSPGANTVKTADQVRELLPRLKGLIPPSIDLQVTMDSTPPIRASLREVETSLAVAVGLVIVVVYAFMRSLRLAAIPCVVVPVAVSGTFCVMYFLGLSINNISLMALTVATGFIVDDAIVVLDNVRRHLDKGKSALQAALDGTREIWFTLVSISLALMAAFIPIIFMGGIVGRVFREFAVVVIAAIVVSLLVSLSTTPMLASRWLRPQRAGQANVSTPSSQMKRGWLERLNTLPARARNAYGRSLRWTLRHQPLALLTLAGVVALNVGLYRTIDKGFLPQQDTGRIVGGLDTEQGISFQAARAKFDDLMRVIQKDPAVAHVTGHIGGSQRGGPSVVVTLKPRSERDVSAQQVVDRLRPKLDKLPGASMYLRAGQDIRIGGRGSSAEYQYTLQADELADLRYWEPRVRNALARLPELTDINSDQRDRGLQTSLLVDRDALSRLGLTMRTFDNTLNNAYGQRQVGVIYNPRNQYRVVMELDEPYLQGPESLDQLMLATGIGAQVPLRTVATVEPTLAPVSINRQKGSVATTISFNLPEGGSLSRATEAVSREMSRLGVPVSLRGTFEGTANAFQEALRSQPLLILAAIIAIYLVLGMLYESLVHPITILSTLPSAGVGALLALMLFRTEFSMVALLGVVLLIGIVMKNAIMMIDVAIARQQQARAAGVALSAAQAIQRAAHQRLRPILMTSIAALLTALPLAIGHGEGSELRQPLGMAVVGGLVLSQLLTLYTTPVVFACMDRLRGARPYRREAPEPRPVAAPLAPSNASHGWHAPGQDDPLPA
ncbi:MAG: efflux RND transporter permease subunit [Pseudomonadota bacterium]